MPHPTTLGRISPEQFKRGSRNFTRLSGTAGPTDLPDMTSLAAFSRLQNAIKYCTTVRKTDAAGKESNNSTTVCRRITKFYKDIHADLVYSQNEYDTISCFQSAVISV